MNFLWIFLGGGLGSVLRYAISLGSASIFSGKFPLATFVSNLVACVLLALVAVSFKGRNLDPMYLFLATGFCGGLSTFSTFGMETVQLLQQGNTALAIVNILLSFLAAIFVIWLLWK